MERILLEAKVLRERTGNEGLTIQHAQSDCREKNVPYRDKEGKDIITIWMVTLSMLVDVNMPMNLMRAGIMAALAVSPGIVRHFTFKEKIFSSITERP